MIPSQQSTGTPAAKFHALASKLLTVPKSEIDAQEKREASKAKKSPKG